jgi:Spy/CpxP family protein refolding chaperone
MRRPLFVLLSACVLATGLPAQQPPDQPGRGFPPPDGGHGRRGGGPPIGGDRGGDRADGKWWQNPSLAQKLNLSKDQQRRLEDIFQQNRLKLIDLTAALEREQAILDPLLSADKPQESKVLAQFDRVAEARVALEKANARMLWGFRTVLTADQWKDLQALDGQPGPPPGRPHLR